MKQLVLVGTALVMAAMLMFSCNKNRYDFEHLESAQGSGLWKLPIGTMEVSLDTILNQLVASNTLLSTDDNGDIQIAYGFPMNNLIKGSSLLTIGTFNASEDFTFPNPFVGVPISPVDTTVYFRQVIGISADSATIEMGMVKSGRLVQTLISNLENIREVRMSSPDILKPNGDSLSTTGNVVDLAGCTFRLRDPVTQEVDTAFVLNYAIRFEMTGINVPDYELRTIIGMDDIKLQELVGRIDSYIQEYTYDTAFKLPSKLEGQMTLVGGKMQVLERNTFGNLDAMLRITRGEFYGGGATPSQVFSSYPVVMDVEPTPTFIDIAPNGPVSIGINTKHEAFGVDMAFDLNPSSNNRLVHIYDTSSLSIRFDAAIPMRFTSDGVYYLDTIDLNLNNLKAPEILKEIQLSVHFDSKIPFNLDAQLFTLDSLTGVKTDSLIMQPLHIGGAFDGHAVQSDAVISVTKDRLANMVASKQLAMRFKIDTENHPAQLKLHQGQGLKVMLKADVIYGNDDSQNN
jgi:hypothetical protein